MTIPVPLRGDFIGVIQRSDKLEFRLSALIS